MYTKLHGYFFFAFFGVFLLLGGGVSFAATGTISTSSSHPVIAPGHLGTVTITWSSSGTGTADVWVSMDGAPETLMSRSPSGSASPSWIQAGHDYQFTLYAETNHTIPLATVSVLGVLQKGGNVTASPFVVQAEAGSIGTAQISWFTDGQPDAQVWVSMDGAPETLFFGGASGNQPAPWIQPGHDYQFKLYAGTTHTTVLDSARVYGDLNYKVGVDYHATDKNVLTSSFVNRYHVSGVRTTVQSQLQGMADAGATVIHTRIWMVVSPGDSDFGEAWRSHFPLSTQESTNLRTYAQDVAAIRARDGHRLRLDISVLWIGASDYQTGTPATGLGFNKLSAAEFANRANQSFASVLSAVSDITRPDGRRLVDTIYMDGEVMYGAKANTDWFLTTLYPGFMQTMRAAGITPSLYFIIDGTEAYILDNTYVDPNFSVLNGHRSMFWLYRTLNFLHSQQWSLPQRIDFSCYPAKVSSNYSTLIQRIFDDADATLPSLGLAKKYGAAETFYPLNTADRQALGRAFASQRLVHGRVERVEFWTSPDGGGTGVDVAYPFSIGDYLP